MFGFNRKKETAAESSAEEQRGLSDQQIEKESAVEIETNKKRRKNKDTGPKTIPEDTERYSPDVRDGLSTKQVQMRIDAKLENKTEDKGSKPIWKIIVSNVFTFFNMLLLAIGIALIVFGQYTSCFFLLVMIANTLIGIIQEIRAKLTIDKLKLVTAQSVKVRREKKLLTIPSDQLVLDDIFYLNNGDQVPADAIIKEGIIEVNESLLTGESVPIKKSVGDKIFAGSFLVSGSCTLQAEKVGDYNYSASIQAKAKEFKKPKSELLKSLNKLIKIIAIIIIPIGVATFATQWLNASKTLVDTWDIATQATSYTAGSMVGMIPSGMYLLTSVALAVGVINLGKKKTLVQDIYSIEMLARVNILCLDKTGTLTDGTMKVDEVLVVDSTYDLYKLVGSFLNSFNEANQTTIALSQKYPLNNEYRAKDTIAFSSSRKMSAVTFFDIGTFVLGAPEYVYHGKNQTILRYIAEKESAGYRVVMLCKNSDSIANGELKGKNVPVAIFTLEDHIRDEAPDTIQWFVDNGVEIKIISGDNPLTVSEIAKKCNVPNAEKCVSLEGLSTREVAELVDQYTVFGRVSPEQKAVIVKELQNRQNTVGMTGDGVNDILAMKNADCSIAMANGASSARNAAHLVLLDSNFASLPAVVAEGRRVINNIQRSSSLFLMKTVFTIAFTVIVLLTYFNGGNGIEYPFKTNNILIMELVGIGLPSFFLALQKNDQLITGSFLRNTFSRAIPGAICMLVAIGANYIMQTTGFLDIPEGDSFAFVTFCSLTMAVISLAMVYNCCQPFNTYRTVLFISMCVLFLLLMFVPAYIPAFSSRSSSLAETDYWNFSMELFGTDFRYMSKTMWLILIIYGAVSGVALSLLMKLFEGMRTSDRKNKGGKNKGSSEETQTIDVSNQ